MAEHPMPGAATPLSFGAALVGVGCMLAWLWPDGGWRDAAVAPFSVGLCFLVLGTYRLADVVERAARKILGRE